MTDAFQFRAENAFVEVAKCAWDEGPGLTVDKVRIVAGMTPEAMKASQKILTEDAARSAKESILIITGRNWTNINQDACELTFHLATPGGSVEYDEANGATTAADQAAKHKAIAGWIQATLMARANIPLVESWLEDVASPVTDFQLQTWIQLDAPSEEGATRNWWIFQKSYQVTGA